MTTPLVYESNGRSSRTAAIVGTIWSALLLAWFVLDAAGWIIVILWVFTLPALWDLWSDRRAGLVLDQHKLQWYAGRGEAEIALDEIDYIRLDTRLDL